MSWRFPSGSALAEFDGKLSEELTEVQTDQCPCDEAHREPEAKRQDASQQKRRTEVG